MKLEKLTLDLDGDDDGPGGFTLDDFKGIETGFEKESLEQRKVRVMKARERLRLLNDVTPAQGHKVYFCDVYR